MTTRECYYGACDPLDHGELEKFLRGKVHSLTGITGYHHVPPCPRAGITLLTESQRHRKLTVSAPVSDKANRFADRADVIAYF